jgi:hypothetical protein
MKTYLVSEELLRQVLDALDCAADTLPPAKDEWCDCPLCVAEGAVVSLLAKEPNEPVAWMFQHPISKHTSTISPWEKKHYTEQKKLGSEGGERWLKGEDAERHDIPLYRKEMK